METINKLKLKEILGNILESMQDAKDELIALDGAMGDGDRPAAWPRNRL